MRPICCRSTARWPGVWRPARRRPSPLARPTQRSPRSARTSRRGERFRGISRERHRGLIAKAIDANRIDLYLQPIVTLPQRKVRYYEALSRLRTETATSFRPPISSMSPKASA